jgi:hypothetical protein
MSTMFLPRSEPRLTTYRTFTDGESPMATPTHRAVHSADVPATIEDKSFSFTTTMHQLDSDGYPTRALYYLHKRLLDTIIQPTKARNYILTTPPLSPLFTPSPEVNEGRHYDLEEVDASKLVEFSEQDRVLHELCATIISKDYVRPLTPPYGMSPCHTPPRSATFAPPAHDEEACRIARMLVKSNICDVDEMDMLDMLEVELEIETEMGCATPKFNNGDGTKVRAWSCPSTIQRVNEDMDKENWPASVGKNKRSLLEEMEGATTPCARVNRVKMVPSSEEKRKEKQARRRARNSLNGTLNLRA